MNLTPKTQKLTIALLTATWLFVLFHASPARRANSK